MALQKIRPLFFGPDAQFAVPLEMNIAEVDTMIRLLESA